MRKYGTMPRAQSKTGQQKVQFYCEDEIQCQSGYSLSTLEPELQVAVLFSMKPSVTDPYSFFTDQDKTYNLNTYPDPAFFFTFRKF